jgi:hypothetical protein
MKTGTLLSRIFGLSVIAAVLSAQPIVAAAEGQLPFRGCFHTWHSDQSASDPLFGPVILVKVTGGGRASHFGEATCETIDQIAVLATGDITATYTYTAANGDTLVVKLAGRIVELDPIVPRIDFEGTFDVLEGTGRFHGSSGSGTFAGWAVFNEPFGSVENEGPGFFTFDGWLSDGEGRN